MYDIGLSLHVLQSSCAKLIWLTDYWYDYDFHYGYDFQTDFNRLLDANDLAVVSHYENISKTFPQFNDDVNKLAKGLYDKLGLI